MIGFKDLHSHAWLVANGFLSWLQKSTRAKENTASWVLIAVTAYQEEKWENGIFLKVIIALLGYIFEKTN